MDWPASQRYKRLAVKLLQYTEEDVRYYDMLVGEFRGEVISVAAWNSVSEKRTPVCFHGLFVLPIFQNQGIGACLIDAVCNRVRGETIRPHCKSTSSISYLLRT
jgi:GNAT superfamily N-acetyltransferase